MFVLKTIKKAIKSTYFYQNKLARNYYLQRNFMLSKLLDEEKYTDRKIIYCVKSKTEQFNKMFEQIKISIDPTKRFQVWIDTGLYFVRLNSMTDNQPPMYGTIIDSSLEELIQKMEQYDNEESNNIKQLLMGVEDYVERVVAYLKKYRDKFDIESAEYKNICSSIIVFMNMKNKVAQNLEEAFQRILFWQSIFWQSQHVLMGLGRLDKLLHRFLGVKSENAENLIIEFFDALHKYFSFKSSGKLLGDTGQIIELGGIEPDGSYFCNKLTYGFIYALMAHPLPDPKILLRVSDKMPDDLLQLAIQCNVKGIGCPLLSNDDIVIPAIEKFGYSHSDACDYVTSACWEPLIYGKSLEKNNITVLNYAESVHLMCIDDKLQDCRTEEDILNLYFLYLDKTLKKVIDKLNGMVWEEDPLMSLFVENCFISGKDISKGGAKYNNYGVLGVGLANAVNSLLNLKYIVLKGEFSFKDAINLCVNNYTDNEKLKILVENSSYFGRENDEVVQLVKTITDHVYCALLKYNNKFGGKVKLGLSASNYVETGAETGATFDGRRNGDPLAVHISAPAGVAYTELINFASKLSYDGIASNGNVVDFFISPVLVTQNMNKFVNFIKVSIRKGFFQIQMNVLSSVTLIDAKKHPKKYPNLIVRVWGFSAYFNDLPDNYKELLIKRAQESEMAG